MKKRIVLCIFMMTFFRAGMAQDKIITTSGDTILCRILDVSAGRISYEQKSKDGQTVGRFIPSDRVSEYFRESRLLSESALKSKRPFVSLPSKPFRISIEGGYGHLLSSFSNIRQGLSYSVISSENIDKYLGGMKNGIHFGADFYLLLNEHFGIGAKYSLYASRTELNTLTPINPYLGESVWYNISMYYAAKQQERSYLNYVAPSLFFRQWLDEGRRFALNESLSLGWMFFRDEVRSGFNQLEKGRSFAGNLDLSVEYYLLPCLSVSANAGIFYSKINEAEINVITPDNHLSTNYGETDMDMSRLNFSAGLHFYF